MTGTEQFVAGLGCSLFAVVALSGAALVVVGRRHGTKLASLVCLAPHVLVLMRRLARDRGLPRRVRAYLVLGIAYNVQPINLR